MHHADVYRRLDGSLSRFSVHSALVNADGLPEIRVLS